MIRQVCALVWFSWHIFAEWMKCVWMIAKTSERLTWLNWHILHVLIVVPSVKNAQSPDLQFLPDPNFCWTVTSSERIFLTLSLRHSFSLTLPHYISNLLNLFPSDQIRSDQSLSHVRLCDPMNRSTPGLPIHHQLPELTETHVHRVSDAIQPSHPLSSPSPPAPNPSQHQSLFQWVNSSHEVAEIQEFQL